MLISWKWLQNMAETGDITASEAAARITARGLEVEGHTPDPTCIADIKVAKIIRIAEHPNSDHLHLVDADAGTGELIRVVCGAPGIEEGWIVPFAPIGAKLGDFKIKKSKLRGEESNGMLCSERELGLGSDHDSLLRLSDKATLGLSLADVLAIDTPETVAPCHTDIFEVGLTPDRGDCLSHYGVARELAAALNVPLKELRCADLDTITHADFVSIENSDDCPRYMGIQINNVQVKKSPVWLRRAVEACGARSINNVVDITNFICFELGHPMHAFDADKLAKRKIAVRRAKNGETLLAINHETYTLNDTDIVITDGEKPIALAGVMGGADTEVDENTTNLILEIATFHPTRVRKTSKRLGLHSESSHRYERFVDANGIGRAAARALWLIEQTTPCTPVAIDDRHLAATSPITITLRTHRVQDILGLPFTGATLKRYLEPIGFVAEAWDKDEIALQVPTWRADITREIDIIEEICRGYGFDNFPANLPDVSMKCPHTLYNESLNPTPYPCPPNLYDRTERARLHALREALVAMGLDECMHYTFMDPADPAKMLWDAASPEANPMKIANPMSIEHSSMRTTLVPAMLAALKKNLANQQKSCTLFEVGEVFFPAMRTKDNASGDAANGRETVLCLDEKIHLCMMMYGETAKPWYATARAYDVFDLKGCLESALRILDTDLRIDQQAPAVPWLHDGIQAAVCVKTASETLTIGHLGEVHPLVLKNFDVPGPIFMAELDLSALLAATPGLMRMNPLPRFHFSQRDLSITVKTDVTYRVIAEIIETSRPQVLESWQIFDVYKGKQIPDGFQSISLTFRYRDPQAADADQGRTLSDDEVSKAHAVIVDALHEKLGSTLR